LAESSGASLADLNAAKETFADSISRTCQSSAKVTSTTAGIAIYQRVIKKLAR
jgi:hypothetical protein